MTWRCFRNLCFLAHVTVGLVYLCITLTCTLSDWHAIYVDMIYIGLTIQISSMIYNVDR